MDLSLSKLPWYGQVAAFGVLAAVAAAAFYSFYLVPVRAELVARETRLTALRADLQKAQAIATRLPEFEAEVGALEGRLERLKEVLPEQKDVAELLRRMQTVATQSDLTIKGFRPQPISNRELHAEWPIVLQLEGTYHNLGRFFDEISRFSRIVNISGLSIRALEQPNATATITAECTATTFVLLETPVDPAASAPDPSARASR